MENQQQFKLIQGTFTPAQAGKVLYSLIQSKINYHNVEILASHERADEDVSYSENRVKELHKVRSSLKELVDMAENLHMKMQVEGYIEITLLK